MSRMGQRATPSVVVVATGLAVAAVVAWVAVGSRGSALVLIIVNVVIFTDLFDLLARVYLRATQASGGGLFSHAGPSSELSLMPLTPHQKRRRLHPYALLVSIHNASRSLPGFFHTYEKHRPHLWVVDDASTDDTAAQLRVMGYPYLPLSQNAKKPAALKQLLATLPEEVTTVVVLDPDMCFLNRSTTELSNLEEVIFDFQQSGMQAVCPRVAVRHDGWLTRFQGFEYCLSQLLGRKSLGSLSVNSGVSIYQRSALEDVLARHSLSVYAEDLENSVLILGAGGRIYFDDRLVVETEGKRTLAGLFSQRVGWAYGHLRVYTERLGDIRRIAGRGGLALYQFVVYLGVFTLALHPVRLLASIAIALSLLNGLEALLAWAVIPETVFTDPRIFSTIYLQYLILALIGLAVAVPRGERLRHATIVPVYLFYALLNLIPTTLGYANWISVRKLGRRLYDDHYDDNASLAARANGSTTLAEAA